MSKSIRGLTVEIAADASKFKAAMTDLRKESRTSQEELNALQKSLKLEYNADNLVKAQQAAQRAIDSTNERATLLRERMVELEKAGKVDTDGYKKLQTDLIKTENEAKILQNRLKELDQMKFDHLASGFEKAGKSISEVGKKLTVVSAGATALLGTFTALGKSAVSNADNIATLATQYNMTAEALERMNYIALQTDTAAEDMYKGLVKVRAGMADIATGATSNTSKALQKLNLDLTQFNNSDEQFYAIIAALASMEDETQRVAAANDIFGDKLANSLIPIIAAGGDAISEYADEFKEVGALSNDQVASLAEFDNVLNKLKTQFANVAAQIGASFLPIMQQIADVISTQIVPKLQQLADWFNGLSVAQQEFAAKALLITAAIGPVVLIIGSLVGKIGGLIKMIPALKAGLDALNAHPILKTISIVIGLIAILYASNEEFRNSINNLIGTLASGLAPVLTAVANILTTVIDLFMPLINLVANLLAKIMPLINLALIPLNIALQALSVPLTMLGEMLKWLAPLFTTFANIVQRAFSFVLSIVNTVLKGIEIAVNGVISIINGLISAYNNTLGWIPGVSKIGYMDKISLQVQMPSMSNTSSSSNIDTSGNPSKQNGSSGYPWDSVNSDNINYGDNYEYNYDNSTKTQNVTVVIENYAQEVDVDGLVQKINIKLAEAL